MTYLTRITRSSGLIFVLSITVVIVIGFSAGAAQADPFVAPTFGDATFSNPTDITNPFLTLEPETAFCYEAETEDGTEKNEVTVTTCDQVTIAGVDVIVVRDAVRLEGDLTEDTFDFYAQDDAGNVWYLGEASAECESGNTEGSWITGLPNPDDPGDPERGEAGIVMLAAPVPGNAYRQEFLENVAEDMAKVQRLNAKVSVQYDPDVCKNEGNDCLKTKEWTPLERGAIEFKYFDPDPNIGGLVLTEELQGGPTVGSELVDIITNIGSTTPDDFCPSGAISTLGDLQAVLDQLCDPEPTNHCD
jgi:hypothetical protein